MSASAVLALCLYASCQILIAVEVSRVQPLPRRLGYLMQIWLEDFDWAQSLSCKTTALKQNKPAQIEFLWFGFGKLFLSKEPVKSIRCSLKSATRVGYSLAESCNMDSCRIQCLGARIHMSGHPKPDPMPTTQLQQVENKQATSGRLRNREIRKLNPVHDTDTPQISNVTPKPDQSAT